MGHAITASRPLFVSPDAAQRVFAAYRVNGTPADCVALGSYHWDKVDVVLSGCNLGFNIGNCDLAFGHARGREAGGAARHPRIAFSAPAGLQDYSPI